MEAPNSGHDQSHPLYSSDRDHVDRLLAKEVPQEADLVDLARLFMRYQEFPGAQDLKDDMIKTIHLWGLSVEDLNKKTREIWGKGYIPGISSPSSSGGTVGSGFDTADDAGQN